MVRALPNSPWHLTDFLVRVRPGLAVSATLHAALLLTLAYFLAFAPPKLPTIPEPNTVTLFDIPLLPHKKEPPPPSKFQPVKIPEIPGIHTEVPPLILPPVDDFSRHSTTETPATPAANDVIIDPVPIYRGSILYPERAVDDGRSGFVDVAFMIEPDGSVGEPQIIDEVPPGYGFANAAMKAFGKWRFDPKTVNGRPIAWPARIRISFELK